MPEFLFQKYGDAPLWSWLLQGLGVGLSYWGAELNARMRISGFYVWLVSNVVMAALHALSGLWLLMVLNALYFRLSFLGILRWEAAHPGQLPGWVSARLGR